MASVLEVRLFFPDGPKGGAHVGVVHDNGRDRSLRILGRVYQHTLNGNRRRVLWGWESPHEREYGFPLRKQAVKNLVLGTYAQVPRFNSLAGKMDFFYTGDNRPELPEA